ncbi:S-layer homology domain-containing protein [Actinomycetaceae bacterium TAE3-ERU4]|nr:S-layer homology domain-containing protein [Actinomycetaceae bacterium TAE3-ERU4]
MCFSKSLFTLPKFFFSSAFATELVLSLIWTLTVTTTKVFLTQTPDTVEASNDPAETSEIPASPEVSLPNTTPITPEHRPLKRPHLPQHSPREAKIPKIYTAHIDIPQTHPFWDTGDWFPFEGEIAWARKKGIARGYFDFSFRPETLITRQALAAFFYRLAGSPNFTPPPKPTFRDVGPQDPFYKEIEWMSKTGISTGWNDKTFRPGLPLQRNALAAFIKRYCDSTSIGCHRLLKEVPNNGVQNFSDMEETAPFAKEIGWLASSGITTGITPDKFGPLLPVERGAMIAFIFRMAENRDTPRTLPAARISKLQLPISKANYSLLGKAQKAAEAKNRRTVYFQNGAVITGRNTLVVHSDIYRQWKTHGDINGKYGFPTNNQHNFFAFPIQDFERGNYLIAGGSTRRHNVPWHGQQTNYYCGPASAQMILDYRGKHRAIDSTQLSQRALASNKYLKTDQYGYTSFHTSALSRGINKWVGKEIYKQRHTPNHNQVREAILKSFHQGWPVVVDSQERRGGPHFNGHNNATFSHIMVIDSYDYATDSMLLADPGANGSVWTRAKSKFWVPSVKSFTKNHLQHEIINDGRRHIGIYYSKVN